MVLNCGRLTRRTSLWPVGVYPPQWSDIIITLCIDCDGTYQCSLMHSDCGKIFAKKYYEKQ